jgi:serine/threonine protein kinase
MAKMRELGANDRLTDSGTTVGTPAYMAPEQALGQDVGPWTDLYSVGVIAYELLSGRVPFDQSEPPMAIMLRHLNDETPPLLSLNADLDPELCDWVEAMLAKDTRGRPSGAAEAADELEEIMIRLLGPRWRRQSRLLGEATGAAPASILESTFVTRVLRPTRQFPKSHRRAWIVAVVTAAALLGSVGITAAVALSDGPPSSNGVTEQTTTGGTETPKSQPIAAPSLASIGVSEDGDTVTATMRLTGGKLNPRTIAIDDAEITDGAASFEIRQKGIAAQTSGGSFGPISMRVRKGPGHVLINVRSTTGAFATFRAHRMDAHTVVVTLVKPAPPSSSTSTGTDTQPKDTTTPPPTKPKKPELESG